MVERILADCMEIYIISSILTKVLLKIHKIQVEKSKIYFTIFFGTEKQLSVETIKNR